MNIRNISKNLTNIFNVYDSPREISMITYIQKSETLRFNV